MNWSKFWGCRSALAVGLAAAIVTPAQAQQSTPAVKVNALELTISGRVQTQFNTTTVESEPTGEFLVRRARLEAKVKINDVVSGKVQPDFAGDRLSLKDAYMQLQFTPGFAVLAGKAHRPFSLIEQTSSLRTLPIERGVRVRGLAARDEYGLVNGLKYSDRDVGLQVLGSPEGAPLGFSYQVGVFGGPLQGEVGSEDTYQLAARATIEPLPGLRLGSAWSSRDFAREAAAAASGWQLQRGHAFTFDAEYGSYNPGVHLIGELSLGDADPFSGERFLGAQGWIGYRTQPVGMLTTVEPLFRASYGRRDGSDRGGTLLTPGVNVYLGGWNRVQLNYDLWLPEGAGDTVGSFKAQFQMAF